MDYQLFSWGANSHGQLGLGYQSEQSDSPEAVDLSTTNLQTDKIKKIVGGGGHTLILDYGGKVYSCGWNNNSQTGITDDDNILQFRMIEFLENEQIVDVACGWDSSIALTESGEVFVWGSNVYGQLGLDPEIITKKVEYPYKIKSIGSKVKVISMGLRHSAIVLENGEVLVTGTGNKCQLGIVDDEDIQIQKINSFTRVPGLQNIINVACGQHFTVALSEDNQVYSWGNNKYGQLGFEYDEMKNCKLPKKVSHVFGGITKLAVGWTHVSILDVNGKISSWGRNSYGQLGVDQINESSEPRIIERIPKIRQLELGSEHNIAMDDNGKILSWGWNEHGNCGNGSTRNIFEPFRIKFPEDSVGVLIGSGAGHSFSVMKREKRRFMS